MSPSHELRARAMQQIIRGDNGVALDSQTMTRG